MKGSDKQFIRGYNAQIAVDADSQVIVAATVTNQAADADMDCSPGPAERWG